MRWSAAMSIDADGVAAALSSALATLGYAHTRDVGARSASSPLLVVELPRTVATHRFRVTAPADFLVEVYDTTPTPGALLPRIELLGVLPGSEPAVRALLSEATRRLPRPPWRFTWGQRLTLGVLSREVRAAPREWSRWVPTR